MLLSYVCLQRNVCCLEFYEFNILFHIQYNPFVCYILLFRVFAIFFRRLIIFSDLLSLAGLLSRKLGCYFPLISECILSLLIDLLFCKIFLLRYILSFLTSNSNVKPPIGTQKCSFLDFRNLTDLGFTSQQNYFNIEHSMWATFVVQKLQNLYCLVYHSITSFKLFGCCCCFIRYQTRSCV